MEMKGIKKIFGASAFACFILVAAAVWLGGLNQDEGWYLYAANLVSEGRMPYRDFFYTQGPLLPIAYSPFRFVWDCAGLLGARIFTALIGVAGIFVASCFAGDLVERGKARIARLTVFILLACNLYHIYYVSIPKTYALAALSLSLGFWLTLIWLVIQAWKKQQSRLWKQWTNVYSRHPDAQAGFHMEKACYSSQVLRRYTAH